MQPTPSTFPSAAESSQVSGRYFLSGGGEMGALMRDKDWTSTPLGDPAFWPAPLRTAVGIMLNTRFPMFLFWGPDLLCFYNDAYRPSLGSGNKHPRALGMPAAAVWEEIWETIGPQIDQVMTTGVPTWHEDQYIPIYRNGRLDDVFWTYSYSPLPDESGKPVGVLVTCNETTSKVQMMHRLTESEQRFRSMIMQSPVAICILRGPDFIVEVANEGVLEIWGKTSNDVLNKPLFEALPEAREQGIEELLRNVFSTGERYHTAERPVKLPHNGRLEIKYLRFVYEAIQESDGTISGIMAVATDVTDQVLARQKVEESETRFRQLADAMPQIVWTAQPDGSNDYVNAQWYQYTASDEPYNKQSFAKILHPDDLQRSTDAWRYSVRTGQPFNIEYRFADARRPGEYRWFLGRANPVRDANGVIVKWYGTATDIHDQKLAGESLTLQASILESMTEGVSVADENGFIVFTNPAEDLMFGYNRGELIGQHVGVQNAYPPEENNRIVQDVIAQLNQTGHWNGEWRNRKKNGDIFYSYARINALVVGEKKLLVCVQSDITERKRVEDAIRESEQKFRTLAESTPDKVWSTDGEGTLMYLNAQMMNYTGLSFDAHRDWSNFIHPDDLHHALDRWQRGQADVRSDQVECRLLRHDGVYRWHLTRAVPQLNAHGEVVMWIGTCIDIDEQKRQSEMLERLVEERTDALRHANEELLRSNYDLMQFASVASHDLKEPLRKIQVFGNMLKKKASAKLEQNEKDYIDRMVNASDRMQNLVDDVLTLSRLSTNDNAFTEVDLNALIRNIVEDLEITVQEKNALVDIQPLPHVEGMAVQLQQLFQNLLINALKFNDKETPRIVIREVPVNEWGFGAEHDVTIVVEDNGIGFDPAYNEKIFGIFQRLHGRSYNGTGIGLAICKKIAANHRGYIRASGDPGNGAVFTLTLPRFQP